MKTSTTINGVQCTLGHTNPALRAFMHKHRHNIIPLRQWGGKVYLNV